MIVLFIMSIIILILITIRIISILTFSKNLKLIKNNDNALPKTEPLARTIKLENYVHAA